MKITKKALSEFLKRKLRTNDAWATRALVVVYSNQTSEEQTREGTLEFNGVGFTGCDARFLTGLAKSLERYKTLTPKQLTVLKKGIAKYWKQVLAVSNMEKLKNKYLGDTLQLELKL